MNRLASMSNLKTSSGSRGRRLPTQNEKKPPGRPGGFFVLDERRDYSAALVMSVSIGSAVSAPDDLRRSSMISSSREVAMRRIWLI
jgi:hypothetical protein